VLIYVYMLKKLPNVVVRAGNFSHHRIQTGSGATQPPIQWVPRTLPGDKATGE